MDIQLIILFIIGLVFLVYGADMLVASASKLALIMGISPLVIGLTVVAFGTSAPELAVNIQSAWIGQSDIAIGNVVGSNIANILLILGAAAVIAPLMVSQQLLRLDVPLMIGASFLLWFLVFDGLISLFDGFVLFAGIVIYTVYSIRKSRQENNAAVQAEYAEALDVEVSNKGQTTIFKQIALLIMGLVLLVVGSNWLVDGAVALAKYFGISELVIGLTIVAIGTSLPELATSIIASLRKEADIAVGNVIGSNLFNILAVLGLSAFVAPNGIAVSESAIYFDIPVMLGVALATLPIFFIGHKVERWQGALFLFYYAAYLVYLVLLSTNHTGLEFFSDAMLWFVIPLTVLTLSVFVWRTWQVTKLKINY
ncbi:calcium/sodium antiporter [Beggiatoa leptomitoformis]|uniref:Calcium/sodium antiporter n=1 Tax=Beggiatoa leptomitoformis TaxID=288004 RepID=A0A2N9YHJ7_9GAMM|nr:calcium/sodium antiporter [Beggiatoa leptomitoformis]ALG67750.1 calcium/sodium antiporter [Beggiatoa leptomitoformis]AUI70008.1 calcium/sodium antiporter [Beggiatoa leptomitoformis]